MAAKDLKETLPQEMDESPHWKFFKRHIDVLVAWFSNGFGSAGLHLDLKVFSNLKNS